MLNTVIALTTGDGSASDAAALIGRLGAPSFDDRVAAYKALEHLGRESLPAP